MVHVANCLAMLADVIGSRMSCSVDLKLEPCVYLHVKFSTFDKLYKYAFA